MEGMLARAHERYRAIVEGLNSEAVEDVPAARRCVGALLGGDIRLFPMPEDHLEAELRGTTWGWCG
jgi:hypothetical protein